MPELINSFILQLFVAVLAIIIEHFVIVPLREKTKGEPPGKINPILATFINNKLIRVFFLVVVIIVIGVISYSSFDANSRNEVDPEKISQTFMNFASINGTLGVGETLQYKYYSTTSNVVTIEVKPIDGFKPTLILYTVEGKEIKRIFDLNGRPVSIQFAPIPMRDYLISVHGVNQNNEFSGGSFILVIEQKQFQLSPSPSITLAITASEIVPTSFTEYPTELASESPTNFPATITPSPMLTLTHTATSTFTPTQTISPSATTETASKPTQISTVHDLIFNFAVYFPYSYIQISYDGPFSFPTTNLDSKYNVYYGNAFALYVNNELLSEKSYKTGLYDFKRPFRLFVISNQFRAGDLVQVCLQYQNILHCSQETKIPKNFIPTVTPKPERPKPTPTFGKG
jgi:hypothetical protein